MDSRSHRKRSWIHQLTGIGLDTSECRFGCRPLCQKNTAPGVMQWVTKSAYSVVTAPNSFGTVGMNSLLGPHYIDTDVEHPENHQNVQRRES